MTSSQVRSFEIICKIVPINHPYTEIRYLRQREGNRSRAKTYSTFQWHLSQAIFLTSYYSQVLPTSWYATSPTGPSTGQGWEGSSLTTSTPASVLTWFMPLLGWETTRSPPLNGMMWLSTNLSIAWKTSKRMGRYLSWYLCSSGSVSLRCEPRLCISNKLPYDADVSGPGATL